MKSPALRLCVQKEPRGPEGHRLKDDPHPTTPEIPNKRLYRAEDIMQRSTKGLPSARRPRPGPEQEQQQQQATAERPIFNLAELIQGKMHAQCSDPRDKVYAFVRLASDCTYNSGIIPDYSKSPIELYVDVVRFCNLAKTGLQFVLDVRDMLGVGSKPINEFVRAKGLEFLPGFNPKWTEQELVNLTAAHMGTVSAVFPNWSEDTEMMERERRAFLKLTVADLSSSLIEEFSNRESLKAFLPQLASQTTSNPPNPPNPALILTGRRATRRVGFACPEAPHGDIVCQFVHSEGAILIRLKGSSSQIIGKVTMMKQRLCEEAPNHPVTGQIFTFCAVSREGLARTTQLQWRLHPLHLVNWEGRSELGQPRFKPPSQEVNSV